MRILALNADRPHISPCSIALDLLRQLVTFDPSQRLTSPQALEHPWLASYHDEDDEPSCPRAFDRWETLEDLETLEQFRDALVKEIEECRMEVRAAAHDDLTDAGSIRSPNVIHEEIPEVEETAEEEAEDDRLMPMPTPSSVIHSRSPTMDRRHTSPEAIRKDSRGPADGTLSPTDPTSAGGTAIADPMLAYARRSSMFLPSRTSSTYSVHRVPSSSDVGMGSSIAFPTSQAPEYIVPMRSRAGSSFGHHGVTASEDRRRLLRTLSTVSIHETGEGHAGGLADIAPIGKYIVDRAEEDAIQSEMPQELAAELSGASDGQTTRKRSGGEEKKRLFTLD